MRQAFASRVPVAFTVAAAAEKCRCTAPSYTRSLLREAITWQTIEYSRALGCGQLHAHMGVAGSVYAQQTHYSRTHCTLQHCAVGFALSSDSSTVSIIRGDQACSRPEFTAALNLLRSNALVSSCHSTLDTLQCRPMRNTLCCTNRTVHC
jgi:hypothetical protein